MKMPKLNIVIFILVMLFMAAPFTVCADVEDETNDLIEIYDYEDLIAIADNPSGNYRLMCDIDLSGKSWSPLYFSGTFDGGGHAVLNLETSQVSTDIETTIDGNWIEYDTVFSGFFGVVTDAEIKDFSLLGASIDIDVSADCFVGILAGYTDDVYIENCSIEGCASLKTDAQILGVGGVVGFGSGEIHDSSVEATLICVDKNAEDKDEQFMGGVNACGYMSIDNVTINIDGYDSDHGYVHNGGISGMFILPSGVEYYGFVTNNTVNGSITFFEDNEDRRAYCVYDIGEIMNWEFDYWDNVDNFESNEVFEYDTDLMPETCSDPTYSLSEVQATCDSYGYTIYTCDFCSYSYKAEYNPKAYNIDEWEIITAATEDSPGVRMGICKDCGKVIYESIPAVGSAAELSEGKDSDSSDKASDGAAGSHIKVFVIIAVFAVVIIIAAIIFAVEFRKYKIKKERKRRLEEIRRRGGYTQQTSRNKRNGRSSGYRR